MFRFLLSKRGKSNIPQPIEIHRTTENFVMLSTRTFEVLLFFSCLSSRGARIKTIVFKEFLVAFCGSLCSLLMQHWTFLPPVKSLRKDGLRCL